jgi:hypothetical protein
MKQVTGTCLPRLLDALPLCRTICCLTIATKATTDSGQLGYEMAASARFGIYANSMRSGGAAAW